MLARGDDLRKPRRDNGASVFELRNWSAETFSHRGHVDARREKYSSTARRGRGPKRFPSYAPHWECGSVPQAASQLARNRIFGQQSD